MTVFQAATSTDLITAFTAAQSGDRIELAPGNYGATALQGMDFPGGLTIASQDPAARAVFTNQLSLTGCSGVTITGVDVIAASLASAPNYIRMNVTGCGNITLSDMTVAGHVPTMAEGVDPATATGLNRTTSIIAGFGYDLGINLRNVTGLNLTDVEITGVRIALPTLDVAQATFKRLHVHHVREAVDLSDVSDIVIEDCEFSEVIGWKIPGAPDGSGDHADMIQYWGTQSQIGVHRITIRNNWFRNSPGNWSQSTFGHMRAATVGVTATEIEISGNFYENAHSNAISIADVTGLIIRDNLLVPNDGAIAAPYFPTINLLRCADALVENNRLCPCYAWSANAIAARVASNAAANIVETGNVVLSMAPGPLYWQDARDAALALGTPITLPAPPVIVPPVPPVVTPPPVVVPPVVTPPVPPVVVPAPVPDLIGDMMRAIGDALITAADARKTPMP